MRLIPARVWAMALLSGVLQVLPFPIAGPLPLWRTVFCWIVLTPLLWALMQADRTGKSFSPLQSAMLGYASGFVWYMGNCYWIYQTMNLYGGLDRATSAAILVLFSLYLGLYHALFASLVGVTRRRFGVQAALLLSPIVWVAVELARARITGFPWDLLGLAQVDNRLLTRLAPVTGAYGLSFVIALVNALWLVRLRMRERRHTRLILTVTGVLVVVLYLFGLSRLQSREREQATAMAMLVQENLEVGEAAKGQPEVSEEQLLESFSRLSRNAGERMYLGVPELPSTPVVRLLQQGEPHRDDIILWPESPAPFQEGDSAFRAAMSGLAQQTGAPIIAGNVGIDRTNENARGFYLYNSASFITPQGEFAGRYDKMHLVPFGEYVPFRELFFFAQNLLHEAGTFDAGRRRSVFAVNGHRYGAFICYESIFADEVQQFVLNGADVLVNLSNDGWYGDTSAPWQHLNMVRMRAIENHRWVLRATNTGVTASINPDGSVVEAAPRHQRTSIRVGFGYEEDLTFYTRHGDWFAYLCAAMTAAVCWIGLQRRDAVN